MAIHKDAGKGYGPQFDRILRRVGEGYRDYEKIWKWSDAAYKAAKGSEADKIRAGWQLIFGGWPGNSMGVTDVLDVRLIDWDLGLEASASATSVLAVSNVDWALALNEAFEHTSTIMVTNNDWGLAVPVTHPPVESVLSVTNIEWVFPVPRAFETTSTLSVSNKPWRVEGDTRPNITGASRVEVFPGGFIQERYVLDEGVPPRFAESADLEPWMSFDQLNNRLAVLSGSAPADAVVGTEWEISLGVRDSASDEIRWITVTVVVVEREFRLTGPRFVDVVLGNQLAAADATFIASEGRPPYALTATQTTTAFTALQVGNAISLSGPLWEGAAVGDERDVTINGSDSGTPAATDTHTVTIRVVAQPLLLVGQLRIGVPISQTTIPDTIYRNLGGEAPYTPSIDVAPSDSRATFTVDPDDATQFVFGGSVPPGTHSVGDSWTYRLGTADAQTPPDRDALDVVVEMISDTPLLEADLARDFVTDPGTSDPQTIDIVGGESPYVSRLTGLAPPWGRRSISGHVVTVTADADAPRGASAVVTGETEDATGDVDGWSANWSVPCLPLRGFADDVTDEPGGLRTRGEVRVDGGCSGGFGYERLTDDAAWFTMIQESAVLGGDSATFPFLIEIADGTPTTTTPHTERWRLFRGTGTARRETTVEFDVIVGTPRPVLSLPNFNMPPGADETKDGVIEHSDDGTIEKTTSDPSWAEIDITLVDD